LNLKNDSLLILKILELLEKLIFVDAANFIIGRLQSGGLIEKYTDILRQFNTAIGMHKKKQECNEVQINSPPVIKSHPLPTITAESMKPPPLLIQSKLCLIPFTSSSLVLPYPSSCSFTKLPLRTYKLNISKRPMFYGSH